MKINIAIIIFFIFIIFIILLKIIFGHNYADLFVNFNKIKNMEQQILNDDIKYFNRFYKSKKMESLINNNKINSVYYKKNKILFITYDNRENNEYISLHNININNYAKKFGYEYKYFNYCDKNVYWCKIYLVLTELLTNNYDYVVWLDSDTFIKKSNIDIGNIFNMFSSDIFVGLDNNTNYGLINAGIFAISNTKVGKHFLYDCINNTNTKCFNNDGTLGGVWAASCYEQGIMNILIDDKYFLYTTVLPNEIFFNYNICSNNVFLMHLYASTPESRVSCFKSKNI